MGGNTRWRKELVQRPGGLRLEGMFSRKSDHRSREVESWESWAWRVLRDEILKGQRYALSGKQRGTTAEFQRGRGGLGGWGKLCDQVRILKEDPAARGEKCTQQISLRVERRRDQNITVIQDKG